jgi:hypothetical protein
MHEFFQLPDAEKIVEILTAWDDTSDMVHNFYPRVAKEIGGLERVPLGVALGVAVSFGEYSQAGGMPPMAYVAISMRLPEMARVLTKGASVEFQDACATEIERAYQKAGS